MRLIRERLRGTYWGNRRGRSSCRRSISGNRRQASPICRTSRGNLRRCSSCRRGRQIGQKGRGRGAGGRRVEEDRLCNSSVPLIVLGIRELLEVKQKKRKILALPDVYSLAKLNTLLLLCCQLYTLIVNFLIGPSFSL